MELPRRKPNRLMGYDYAACGAYFITICTKDRCEWFGDVVGVDAHIDPHVVLTPYGEIVQKYIQNIPGIDKYVIMPNHIHMIILKWEDESNGNGAMWASPPTKPPKTVSQLIQSFKILVTKEIGFSLWQRSFYDHIIRNEHEYQQIWKYIDSNPALWLDGKDTLCQ